MAKVNKNSTQNSTQNSPYELPYQTRGTSTDSRKLACEAKGGIWDEASQTCLPGNKFDFSKGLLNQPKKEKPKPIVPPDFMNLPEGKGQPIQGYTPQPGRVNPPKGTVETFTDPKTGRASGVVLPDGRTFLGLNSDDVNAISQQQSEIAQRPINSAQVGTAQAQANKQAIISQLGNIQGLEELTAQLQEAPIDWGQALTAGSVGNFPSLLTNVAGGAVGGAVAGSIVPGVGNIVGGIAGGIGGAIKSIWGGTQANIKSQQRGEINKEIDVLSNAKANIRQLRMLAASDPNNADLYVQAYNEQITQVYIAHEQVKLETQGNLNKFMEDGTDILSDFELFLQPGGYAELQGQRIMMSLSQTGAANPEELLAIALEMQNEENI